MFIKVEVMTRSCISWIPSHSHLPLTTVLNRFAVLTINLSTYLRGKTEGVSGAIYASPSAWESAHIDCPRTSNAIRKFIGLRTLIADLRVMILGEEERVTVEANTCSKIPNNVTRVVFRQNVITTCQYAGPIGRLQTNGRVTL